VPRIYGDSLPHSEDVIHIKSRLSRANSIRPSRTMPGNGNKFTTFSTLPWTESITEWRQNELCALRIRSLRALGSHCAADGVVLPNLLREIDSVMVDLAATCVSGIISSIENSGFSCDRSCVRVRLTQLQVICACVEPLLICM
jgi:hypothetical protein